ncbi:MAG: hypothetical protein IK079_05320 [Desulfovibrio sp.]|nr:hypothetical protein [Desulfovibrio sp.]
MRWFSVFFLIVLFFPNNVWPLESFATMWKESIPLMNKGMEIIAQGVDPDQRSFSEIITFRDSKFQRILKECFEILADSETLDLLEKRDKLQRRIVQKRQKIVELQKEMIAAPEEHWNPLAKTKGRIKSAIADLREEIARSESEIEAAKQQAVESIQRRGIPISHEQMEAILNAADGEEIASIMAVAENVKSIQGKIEELLRSPDAPIELLKTYTGIYMMCHKVYTYAIEHALTQITTVYFKRLEQLHTEATQLLQSARSMLREATDRDRKILETNVSTNQRTLEVIRFYTQYLNRQKSNLEHLQAKAKISANVAVNTYRTVKTGAELLRMMKSTETDFTQIFSFEPPNLSLLYDERFKVEFQEITEKLRLRD